eukprot:XP_011614411.1 PREDICTED: glutamate-rich protein 1 isoform X1 [Takifugu rubripes]
MARRKEVFQSKVLQRLFPAAPKYESSKLQVENPSNPPCRKRKASRPSATTAAAGKTLIGDAPGRRVYTVLLPPPDYKADSERSPTRFQLDGTSDKDTAESRGDTDGDSEREEEKGRKRRKRRKKKPSLRPDCEKDGAAEPSVAPGQGNEGGEGVSKNKRRKLKKKRRKEKLLSMGLVPQAAAVEFTYRKDDEGNDESGRRVAEVSDFLRSTMKLYVSDTSPPVHELRLLSGTVEDLLSSLASGDKPTSVLKQLSTLQSLVQRRETDKLAEALEELRDTSALSEGETAAVGALLQYWITDILPAHGGEEAELPQVPPGGRQSR